MAQEPVVALDEVVEHRGERGGRLVRHDPPARRDLHLARLDRPPQQRALRLVGLIPIARQERNLPDYELVSVPLCSALF